VLIPGRDLECDAAARSQAGISRDGTPACHNVALGVNSAELAPGLAHNGVIASPAANHIEQIRPDEAALAECAGGIPGAAASLIVVVVDIVEDTVDGSVTRPFDRASVVDVWRNGVADSGRW
jgi:hypothetical protein